MANVSSSNGLEKRPKLRFPGFDEPYKQCHMSQTARSVVKQTGCFVGRSRAAVSGGRCVLSPPDCFVA